MIHSASCLLPLLLLSNVVGDIHEGCYLLLWAGLPHVRQYFQKKKKGCRYVQQKLQHSRATLSFLVT